MIRRIGTTKSNRNFSIHCNAIVQNSTFKKAAPLLLES